MTNDDSRRQESVMTARETLRAELLTSGLSDEVPLAEVETVINRLELTKTTAERQELALSTMRSLVADGLMQFYVSLSVRRSIRRSQRVGVFSLAVTHRCW